MVAENIFAQCDDNDNIYKIFDEIIDCYKDGDLVFVVVKWKDGNTSSVPLHVMKESEPLATAEYTVAAQVEDWPEFASWVRPVLNRRKQIIAKVASRRFLNTKFGLPLPMTAEKAYSI